MKKYTYTEILPNGRVNPDKSMLECENPDCNNIVIVGQSHSFIVIYATTGEPFIPSFQCEEEQHFACSPECAKIAAINCIENHLIPKHQEMENANNG